MERKIVAFILSVRKRGWEKKVKRMELRCIADFNEDTLLELLFQICSEVEEFSLVEGTVNIVVLAGLKDR